MLLLNDHRAVHPLMDATEVRIGARLIKSKAESTAGLDVTRVKQVGWVVAGAGGDGVAEIVLVDPGNFGAG